MQAQYTRPMILYIYSVYVGLKVSHANGLMYWYIINWLKAVSCREFYDLSFKTTASHFVVS